MIATVLFLVLILTLFLSVPIGICLGLATMAVMILVDGTPPLVLLARSVVTGADSFPLIAVPLFILAGDLMQHGGMSRRLVGFANALIGHIRAGLSYVNVLACVFFAAISGSSPATVAAIGSNLIPEMEKVGYTRRFSASLTASSGMIGVMIPPSIPFIIYGVTAEVSIGKLFLAGIVPGVMFAVMFMIVARFLLRNETKVIENTRDFDASLITTSFRKSVWALLVPVIILGGIYSGIFTPTEAGAVAVVYAAIVGKFVYGDLEWSDFPTILAESARTSGMILVLVIMATAFGRVITLAQIPADLAGWLTGLSDNPIIILAADQRPSADHRDVHGDDLFDHHHDADPSAGGHGAGGRSDCIRRDYDRQPRHWLLHAASGGQPLRRQRHLGRVDRKAQPRHPAVLCRYDRPVDADNLCAVVVSGTSGSMVM
ncbi:Sialic acid TRAP transporter permease protein SiaT [Marinovum algicola]|nr:Sialic acid TRAP transporter permease protein SiaT [Marinovum algicola]